MKILIGLGTSSLDNLYKSTVIRYKLFYEKSEFDEIHSSRLFFIETCNTQHEKHILTPHGDQLFW